MHNNDHFLSLYCIMTYSNYTAIPIMFTIIVELFTQQYPQQLQLNSTSRCTNMVKFYHFYLFVNNVMVDWLFFVGIIILCHHYQFMTMLGLIEWFLLFVVCLMFINTTHNALPQQQQHSNTLRTHNHNNFSSTQHPYNIILTQLVDLAPQQQPIEIETHKSIRSFWFFSHQ